MLRLAFEKLQGVDARESSEEERTGFPLIVNIFIYNQLNFDVKILSNLFNWKSGFVGASKINKTSTVSSKNREIPEICFIGL